MVVIWDEIRISFVVDTKLIVVLAVEETKLVNVDVIGLLKVEESDDKLFLRHIDNNTIPGLPNNGLFDKSQSVKDPVFEIDTFVNWLFWILKVAGAFAEAVPVNRFDDRSRRVIELGKVGTFPERELLEIVKVKSPEGSPLGMDPVNKLLSRLSDVTAAEIAVNVVSKLLFKNNVFNELGNEP